MFNRMKHGRWRPSLAVVASSAAALAFAACGGDDSTSSSSVGNGTDLAFVKDMVPHHESAVEMAKVAQAEGESKFVKDLATDIVRSQDQEITVMRGLATKIADSGVEAGSMGMSMDMSGMDAESLRGAEPFDRVFVDKMIPHHQDAIKMARIEKDKGQNAETKRLADAIIAAQAREIEAMNAFRKGTFGAVSPAGGVPAPGDTSMSMDHSGM
jgi:uncharacterized protein (DUF305 family)